MDIIGYHADCPDGFCAAFIAHKRWPRAELAPLTHGQTRPLDKFAGKDVLIVDFSYNRDVMEQIRYVTRKLLVLDHHKTAEAELAGLDYCEFDMNRSGAQMSWDYCFGATTKTRPWYVEYVADRDLWKWNLPDSKEINAYIMILGHEVTIWEELEDMMPGRIMQYGTGIRTYIEHYIGKVCEQSYTGHWDNFTVSIVNVPYLNISDIANELCNRGADIGMGWFVRGDGQMQFSLRSVKNNVDVSALAKIYGGGGHLQAAGFELPYVQGLIFLSNLTGAKA